MSIRAQKLAIPPPIRRLLSMLYCIGKWAPVKLFELPRPSASVHEKNRSLIMRFGIVKIHRLILWKRSRVQQATCNEKDRDKCEDGHICTQFTHSGFAHYQAQ